MKLVKKVSGNLIYSDIPKEHIIVVSKSDSLRHVIYSYYLSIKDKCVDDGKYMIKRFKLQYHVNSWNRFAKHKSYFCYADSGICYTYDKKHKVFKINNRVKAVKLIKLLLQNDPEYLYALVNRNDGKEVYFISNSIYYSELHKNDLIILK